MARSDLEAARRLLARSEGIDFAPWIRASGAGDLRSVPPEVVAIFADWMAMLDPEIVYDASALDIPDLGAIRGPDGVIAFWMRWIEDWEHYSWTVRNMAEVESHVVFDAQVHATGMGSGAEVTLDHSQVWTFREGKLIRLRIFKDRASALAAIG